MTPDGYIAIPLNRAANREPFLNDYHWSRNLKLKQTRQISRPFYHPHDLHFLIYLDEEYQVTPMPRVTQPFVQIVALLEAAGALAYLNNLRLDLGHERCGARAIVERDEVANVHEVCPCSGQDNDVCHDQDLSA
ncbi:hypothetical protein DSM14862_03667 (plasmid) [Sulfitobacter indolifex]|nr:hypothetical protein DSM14862_03440 [Sulfitobacter indolifex]UOA20829.1 hypothetical protein DSM14862_03667 [Sulfitobacter indolifex]